MTPAKKRTYTRTDQLPEWTDLPVLHHPRSLPQPVGPRRTFYVGPVLEKLLSLATAFGSATASTRLETIARRFEYFRDAMFADQREKWSANEWAVLALALRSGAGLVEYDAWKLVVYFAAGNQAQFLAVHQVDALATAHKLRDYGEAMNIAVTDTVEQYWAHPPGTRHTERLRLLGLIDARQAREFDDREPSRRAAIRRLARGRK